MADRSGAVTRLDRAALSDLREGDPLSLPAARTAGSSIGIVHLGIGAFYRAHQADRDQVEGAFRLAQAWMAEAHALQKEDSPNATVMWNNAAAQCELAFDLDPTNARLAMTAASCHHFAGEHDAANAWAQIGKHLAAEQTPAEK